MRAHSLPAACALCAVLALGLAAPRSAHAQSAVASEGARTTGTEILRMAGAGRYEQARTLGMERVAAVGSDIDAYVGLSWSLIALGKFAEAERWAARGYEAAQDPRLAQAIGEAAFHLGKNDLSLSRLREYLGSFPEGGKAGVSYYLCGELYVRKARFQHADIAFTAALQYVPNNPSWWARLGYARENAGRILQALKAYEKAIALDSRQNEAIAGRQRLAGRLRQ